MADQPKSATFTVTKHEEQKPVAKAEAKAATKDAPTQQVVNPGDTVTVATVTLGALITALFVTNNAPSPPTLATWVFPGTLQLVYGDMSLVTVRFEARQFVPTTIRTY